MSHCDDPSAAATRPSTLDATLATTNGPAGAAMMQVGRQLTHRALGADTDRHVDPAARSPREPGPATRGSGSSSAATTRVTPAPTNASAHGGRAPVVRAGLEGDVRPSRRARVAGLGQRAGLGVGSARRLGRAHPDDLAVAERARSRPRDWARCGGGRPRRRPVPAPSPRRRACACLGHPTGRGNDDGPGRMRATGDRARRPGTASMPSPIRTLTVGPGVTPGRRPTGGRAFAGLDAVRDGLAAAPCRHRRSGLSPNPEGSVVLCSARIPRRAQNCNVF